MHADFGMQVPRDDAHRLWSRTLGGGALYDVGIYPVTFAHLFLGMPSSVQAWARMSAGGVDENTGILLGYDSGAVAALTCGLVGDTARRATITGTTGGSRSPATSSTRRASPSGTATRPRRWTCRSEGAGYHFEAAEVHRCLREGLTESPLVPLAETLEILTVLDVVRVKVGLDYSG